MDSLELLALRWLRFEKRCPIALRERTPRFGHGKPDILGITHDRYLLEIEIKRSLSDFRANHHKNHVSLRPWLLDKWPRYYWFLVPADLAGRVCPEVPDWAGLLRGPSKDEIQQLVSVVKSPRNSVSKKLTIKECLKLGHLMANHILSVESSCEGLRNRMNFLQGNLYDPEWQI